MAYRGSRYFTNYLYDLADEGAISWQQVAEMCLKFLSEDDVEQMLTLNDMLPNDDDDDEGDDDDA